MDRQLPPVRRDPLLDVVLRCTAGPPASIPSTRTALSSSAATVGSSPSVGTASSRAPARSTADAQPRPDVVLTPRLRDVVIAATKRTLLTPGAMLTLTEIANRTGIEESAVRTEFGDIQALLTATMLEEIETVIAGLAHRELSESLVRAALTLSDSALLEALAGPGAAVLAQMARVDVRLPGWQLAARAVEDALSRAGRTGSPMVLRWLASYLCAPSTEDDIRRDVDILVAGLPPVTAHDRWHRRPTG